MLYVRKAVTKRVMKGTCFVRVLICGCLFHETIDICKSTAVVCLSCTTNLCPRSCPLINEDRRMDVSTRRWMCSRHQLLTSEPLCVTASTLAWLKTGRYVVVGAELHTWLFAMMVGGAPWTPLEWRYIHCGCVGQCVAVQSTVSLSSIKSKTRQQARHVKVHRQIMCHCTLLIAIASRFC